MTLIRIISFFIVALIGLFFPVWLFAVAVCAYAFLFVPYEVVILGALIDAYFGSGGVPEGYVYTITTSVILIASAYLRPRLMLYT